MSSDFLQKLSDHLETEGGFSIPADLGYGDFSRALGGQPKAGYIVALGDDKASGVSIPYTYEAREYLALAIQVLLSKYLGIVTANAISGTVYMGGWVDTEDPNGPRLYLDWSEQIPDLKTAMLKARERNQLAIWDVAAGEEIRTETFH